MVKIAAHVGHRWKKDRAGVYCADCSGTRLYVGTCYNSPRLQLRIAESLDRLRVYLRDELGVT